ncbi:MAG: helix-turn-helix transcriptional regulator [Klebsiella quasipneumoniae]|nr:helix-turn-helix transcriptional regulator [Klebsiella quasipneumoniae]
MYKVSISYSFDKEGKEAGNLIKNDLIAALSFIEKTKSLTKSAEAMGISYRHLWNQINQWEKEFSHPLLERGRGKTTELTPYAKRLLWAEKEVQAKFHVEIASLRAGIEQAFAIALDDAKPIVLAGCPDSAVLLLREKLHAKKVLLQVEFNSSLTGLQDLKEKKVLLSGFNFPSGSSSQSEAARLFSPYLDSREQALIGFATRIQSLAVAKGNPLEIYSLLDLVLKKARFVNRPVGTGTRALLDELLKNFGIAPDEINGYDNIVSSASSVATQIASGKADAGICLASIAADLDLCRIPLIKEQYFFCCRKENLNKKELKQLIRYLQSTEWKKEARALQGYDFADSGKVLDIQETLNWQ